MNEAAVWLRRDLRLEDNNALYQALKHDYRVIVVFIFDSNILNELPKDDPRVSYIHSRLSELNKKLTQAGGSLLVYHDTPSQAWTKIIKEHDLETVYCNRDYEPYAIKRDKEIRALLNKEGIRLLDFKDQVIFEQSEILKSDGTPYTVFTPYKNKWIEKFKGVKIQSMSPDLTKLKKVTKPFPSLKSLGFTTSKIKVRDLQLTNLKNYQQERDFPAIDSTSYLSVHLRFGTVSIRQIIEQVKHNESFLNELIWREFFMQILFHYPHVVHSSFRSKYDQIQWRNDEKEFEKWKNGQTGYPIVDAGMRQLNQTGYMHNRVRMVVASFLCKHLLIDWRWGEAYFAEKLLDYELSANNGNWQWAAGTGCDAAPYFRVFNPTEQTKKFDKDLKYIRKWVPEIDSLDYPLPMVDHKLARERAIATYKLAIE